MLPITCGILPATAICGILITRIGRFRWAVWIGWLLTTAATGLLILLDETTPTAAWVIIFIFVGVGHGLVLGPCMFAAQAASTGSNVAHATAFYTFSRTVGMCIGVALGGAVFENLLSFHLQKAKLPASIAYDAAAYVTELQAMPRDSALRLSVVAEFTDAFHGVMAVLTGFSALGGLISLLMRNLSMDTALDPGHRLRDTQSSNALRQLQT